MTDRIAELTRRGDALHAEAEKIDRDIAEALANDEYGYTPINELALAEMRQRRRDLTEECDDIAEAIELLELRANDPKIKERQAAAAKARREARQQAGAYRAAAHEFDEALRTLEAKFEALEAGARHLSRSLNASGVGDSARISNTLTPSLRWALWKSSPRLAKAVGLSHTPFNKRQTLRDSASRVIPHIPAE